MEATGSNPVEALIFFRLLPSNCLNWKIYCDDHSSLSSTTAVQHEFHIFQNISLSLPFALEVVSVLFCSVNGEQGAVSGIPEEKR